MITPEVLSPAGDMQRLAAAVQYGADAVYLGAKMFGMRAAPQNFAPDELKQAVGLCHQKGVKVYLTCNTVPTNQEADELPEFLKIAGDCGVDAIIAADVGAGYPAAYFHPSWGYELFDGDGALSYGRGARSAGKGVVAG